MERPGQAVGWREIKPISARQTQQLKKIPGTEWLEAKPQLSVPRKITYAELS